MKRNLAVLAFAFLSLVSFNAVAASSANVEKALKVLMNLSFEGERKKREIQKEEIQKAISFAVAKIEVASDLIIGAQNMGCVAGNDRVIQLEAALSEVYEAELLLVKLRGQPGVGDLHVTIQRLKNGLISVIEFYVEHGC